MKLLLILSLFGSVALAENKALVRDVEDAANMVGVPAKLLLAVCFVESSLRDLKPRMDGSTDSHGVCQMKLETAQHMDLMFKHRIKVTAERLQAPFLNAFYAAKFLRYQLRRYNGDQRKAVEAYNKGWAVSDGNGQYVNRVFSAMVAQNF